MTETRPANFREEKRKTGVHAPPQPVPIAFHLRGTTATELKPEGDVRGAADLPDALLIPPGRYQVHGRLYHLVNEGLYRFLYPMHENQQRIVWQGDINILVSALCWMQSHGSRDDTKTFDDLKRQALTGKLIMTCGPYANFGHRFCTECGLRTRVVNVATLEERNGYNDGHVLLEIQSNGRWLLFDVDQHCLYRQDGRQLDLMEAIEAMQAGKAEIVSLAGSCPLAIGAFREQGYDYSMWMETYLAAFSKGDMLRRVMQVPILHDDAGPVVTCAEKDRARFEANNTGLRWIPRPEFRRRFYNQQRKSGGMR